MANRIVRVHAGTYGIGIYAIMLPSSGFSVAHRTHAIKPNKTRLYVDNISILIGILYTDKL